MIVSYEHNYIFVKTKKTAGTSMEVALSTFTGEKDIVTPVSAEDELKRRENELARLPQNFCDRPKLEARYRARIKNKKLKRLKRFKKHFKDRDMFHNHMDAASIKAKLDPEFFQSAFKFTIQRDPYDRMLSLAYWRHQNPEADINITIDKLLKKGDLTNTEFYLIDDKLAVDFVMRYEHLQEDVLAVEQKIGAKDLWSQFPQTKSGHRTDRRPAREVLTDKQKEQIVQQCKREFELFGYPT